MSISPTRVAAAATVIEQWWKSLPVDERKDRYSLRDLHEQFGGHTGAIGLALEQLGWKRTKSTSRDPKRYWLPPTSDVAVVPELQVLRKQVKTLESRLAAEQEKNLTHEAIRRQIIGLRDTVSRSEPPTWTLQPGKQSSHPGVPTLLLSDWHYGEDVDPAQINDVNEFNVAIAEARAKKCIETAIKLLAIVSPKLEYPGIVVPLGGDMISGDIHEELVATNELSAIPSVLGLYDVLVSAIRTLADTFGHVYLPCVTGNHGRNTRKPWAKNRHTTSFDWLLYQFLAKRFEDDDRVKFFIPDGHDASFRIYGHRYVLTHGDQFRGGDGVIGALGPIIRGDHRKRTRNNQINMGYDTMLLGHWHQYIHLERLIVNGSLKGYDEYAHRENFPFEVPQQALWITHPKHGITYRAPVKLGGSEEFSAREWVSWEKQR